MILFASGLGSGCYLNRAVSPASRQSRCGFRQPRAGRQSGMAGWVSRFLAAIGVGGRKAEADVSYDPALDDKANGGAPGPGHPDLGRTMEQGPDH